MNNIHLFPLSLQSSAEIIALTAVLDSRFDTLKTEVYDNLFIYHLENVSGEILNHLALQFKADGYEFALTREDKEALIQNALDVRLHRGTLFALKKIFASVNIEMVIHEWPEFEGLPFTYRVEMKGKSLEITPLVQQKIIKLLQKYANKRSHLDDISLAYLAQGFIAIIQGGNVTESHAVAETQG